MEIGGIFYYNLANIGNMRIKSTSQVANETGFANLGYGSDYEYHVLNRCYRCPLVPINISHKHHCFGRLKKSIVVYTFRQYSVLGMKYRQRWQQGYFLQSDGSTIDLGDAGKDYVQVQQSYTSQVAFETIAMTADLYKKTITAENDCRPYPLQQIQISAL